MADAEFTLHQHIVMFWESFLSMLYTHNSHSSLSQLCHLYHNHSKTGWYLRVCISVFLGDLLLSFLPSVSLFSVFVSYLLLGICCLHLFLEGPEGVSCNGICELSFLYVWFLFQLPLLSSLFSQIKANQIFFFVVVLFAGIIFEFLFAKLWMTVVFSPNSSDSLWKTLFKLVREDPNDNWWSLVHVMAWRKTFTWTTVDSFHRYIHASLGLSELTHWGRDNMAAISQATFSSAFPWVKIFEF